MPPTNGILIKAGSDQLVPATRADVRHPHPEVSLWLPRHMEYSSYRPQYQ